MTSGRRDVELRSFDGTEACIAIDYAPESEADLVAATRGATFSVRGSGLSYCQAGAVDGIPSITTRGLSSPPSLDPDRSTIRVSAATRAGELIEACVSQGFWFPVLPGHPSITVGGCIAFNTHGKTQHDVGQMSDHVESLRLFHPDHGTITCSHTENPGLFALTVGGMGLTGIILDATVRIEPLLGNSITRRSIPVADFIEAVKVMEDEQRPSVHLYSWNDATKRGDSFGRGIVYAESFDQAERARRRKFRTLDSSRRGRFMPLPAWNRLTARGVNFAYCALESRRDAQRMACLDAAFPINGREGYFHAFGRPGFHEYQIIVPRNEWEAAISEIRRSIASTGACITLSSLKLFAGAPELLWFRGNGVCLTLDGPAKEPTRQLFARLDRLAIELGAPINLSKDSRIEAEATAAIFPGYERFVAELHNFDPHRRVDSQLRRRIGV